MSANKILIGLSTLLALCLFNCSTTSKLETMPNLETLTFEKDIKPIMNTYCGGAYCHHGKPSVWTRYEVIKTSIESGAFAREVIENKTMPVGKPLPKIEFEVVKTWLESGAKEK